MAVSIRAYARHRGVADNAVRKAIKAGRIQLEKEGTIDIAKADLAWENSTDPTKVGSVKRGSVGTGSVKRSVLSSSKTMSDSEDCLATGILDTRILDTGGHSFAQVRIAHEVAKTGLARQRLQEKKGQLINKDFVKAQVFRLGRQFRDAVQNWPSRVCAQMAAELQVDEHLLQVTLEAYLRELLNELGDAKLNVD